MTVYAVAMAEVQDDSVLCEAETHYEWDRAVDAADGFMFRCVGDFYGIDPADVAGRRAKLEERIYRETSVWNGKMKLELKYEVEGLVLCATVQETELEL